jgi:beta-lactamase regulating signal transducer with metallopeptidase domain/peroxiredoxin
MPNNTIHIINLISESWLRFISQQTLLSLIIFVLVLFISLIVRKKSLWLQVGLWGFIFIKVVIPANLGTGLESEADNFSTYLSKDQINISRLRSPSTFQESENKISSNQTIEQSENIYSIHDQTHLNPVPRDINNWKKTQIDFLPVTLFLLWISGTIFFLLHFLRNIKTMNRKHKEAKLVSEKKILEVLSDWCLRFKIKRKVKIYFTVGSSAPYTTGIIVPKIFLSQNLISSLTINEIEPIIAHELAHIRNYDFIISRLQNLISILNFFNPAIWIANSKINSLREEICDSLVMSANKISTKLYCSVLLKAVKDDFTSKTYGFVPIVNFGNSRNKIKERLKNIKDFRLSNFSKIQKLILIILSIFILPLGFNSFSNSVPTISGKHVYKNIPFEIRIIDQEAESFSGIMKWHKSYRPVWIYITGTYKKGEFINFQEKEFILGDIKILQPTSLETDGLFHKIKHSEYKAKIEGDSINGIWSTQDGYDGKLFSGKLIKKGPKLSIFEKDVWSLFQYEKGLRKKLQKYNSEYKALFFDMDNKFQMNVDKKKLRSLQYWRAEYAFEFFRSGNSLYKNYSSNDHLSLLSGDLQLRKIILGLYGFFKDENKLIEIKRFLANNFKLGERYYYSLHQMVRNLEFKNSSMKKDKLVNFDKDKIREERDLLFKEDVLHVDPNKLHSSERFAYLNDFANHVIKSDTTYNSNFIDLLEKYELEKPKDEYYQFQLNSLRRYTQREQDIKLRINEPAPDFRFKDSEDDFRQLSDFRGKVVYLIFWSSQNGTEGIFHLKEIYDKLSEDNFLVLAVPIDNYSDAIQFNEENQLNWIHVFPATGLNADIATLYRVDRLSSGVLIDKKGLFKVKRPLSFGGLESKIKHMLAE